MHRGCNVTDLIGDRSWTGRSVTSPLRHTRRAGALTTQKIDAPNLKRVLSSDSPQKGGQACVDTEKARIADPIWRIVAENKVAQLKLAEEQLRPFQGACVQSVQAINLP